MFWRKKKTRHQLTLEHTAQLERELGIGDPLPTPAHEIYPTRQHYHYARSADALARQEELDRRLRNFPKNTDPEFLAKIPEDLQPAPTTVSEMDAALRAERYEQERIANTSRRLKEKGVWLPREH